MLVIVTLLSVLAACQAVKFNIAPFNTSAVIGQNGTLACIVDALAQGESVQWKKRSGSAITILTLGTSIVANDQTKYAVSGQFNLTVVNVQTSDEGIYQCVVGATTLEANLQTVVLPQNVSTYWESSPTIGHIVNVTCRATYGKPQPYLRLYKENIDITYRGYYHTENIRSNGYVDAVLSVALLLTNLDVNKDIRCEVEYDGFNNAMNYTMNTNLNGASSVKLHGLATVFMFLMIALIQRL